MPRKKKTEQDELPLSIPEPAIPATPEGQAVLEALRSNLSPCWGNWRPATRWPSSRSVPTDRPQINCPEDVHIGCWGPRWGPWPRSS